MRAKPVTSSAGQENSVCCSTLLTMVGCIPVVSEPEVVPVISTFVSLRWRGKIWDEEVRRTFESQLMSMLNMAEDGRYSQGICREVTWCMSCFCVYLSFRSLICTQRITSSDLWHNLMRSAPEQPAASTRRCIWPAVPTPGTDLQCDGTQHRESPLLYVVGRACRCHGVGTYRARDPRSLITQKSSLSQQLDPCHGLQSMLASSGETPVQRAAWLNGGMLDIGPELFVNASQQV